MSQGSFFNYLCSGHLERHPTGLLRWWLLGMVAFTWGMGHFQLAKIAPVTPQVLEDFALSGPQWGYILTLSWTFYALAVLASGPLSDRFGRRTLITLTPLLFALNALQTALAADLLALILSRIVAGFIMGLATPACMAAMRDFSPRRSRARAHSLILAAQTLGLFLTNWWAAWLLPLWPDWRGQFYTAALLAVANFFLVLVFLRDLAAGLRLQVVGSDADLEAAAARASALSAEELVATPSRMVQVLRFPRLWSLALALGLWIIAFQSIVNYGSLFFVQALGMEVAQGSQIISWYFLAFTASVFLSGWLSDHILVRKTLTAFGGVSFGLILLAFVSPARTMGFLSLATLWVFLGFLSGFVGPPLGALYSENVEAISPYGVGTATALNNGISRVMGILMNATVLNVVAFWGWSAWWQIASLASLLVALTLVPGKGPWLPASLGVSARAAVNTYKGGSQRWKT